MGLFSGWNKGKSNPEIGIEQIREARERVRGILPLTPLTRSYQLSDLIGHDVYLKWDNTFKSGSFKERGACNFLEHLSPAERQRGVCAASAGNHAMALSSHAQRLGIPCTIVMPTTAPLVKVSSTERNGAQVLLHGLSLYDAYGMAQSIAKEKNLTFVPPYDHEVIIAGQGTCGLEILEQEPDVDSIIIPVGGGGLCSGVAIAAKALKPDIFILGAQSEWAVQSRLKQNAPSVLAASSIADGIAVKGEGVITKPLLARYVDKLATLSEEQLSEAIVKMVELERTVVEGAGGAGVAALLARELPRHCRKTAVVVTGSNIDINILARLIQRGLARESRLIKVKVSVPDRPGMLHRITGVLAEQGANVLDVHHSRFFVERPGNVNINFLVEVRNQSHQEQIVKSLTEAGVEVLEN